MKNVPLIEGERYPDFGSNFETFTNAEFLELETLGPLKRISAGETFVHNESWVVFSDVHLPEPKDEAGLLESIGAVQETTVEPLIYGSSPRAPAR